ncbi:MAG: PEP-CTERM sorting domain-containing protein [Planctomycetota bacterium]
MNRHRHPSTVAVSAAALAFCSISTRPAVAQEDRPPDIVFNFLDNVPTEPFNGDPSRPQAELIGSDYWVLDPFEPDDRFPTNFVRLRDESRLDIKNGFFSADQPSGPPVIRFAVLNESVLDIQDGFFAGPTVVFAREQASVRIRGGVFTSDINADPSSPIGGPNPGGLPPLRLRFTDDGPGSSGDPAEDPGRIQLFVSELISVENPDGSFVDANDLDQNLTLDVDGETRISGIWANGDEFADVTLFSFGQAGFVNIWQTAPEPESEIANVDLNSPDPVTIDLFGGETNGGLTAMLSPDGGTGLDGESAEFTAEFTTGHATQLGPLFTERGIPLLDPELLTGNDEGFDVWFLDYEGGVLGEIELTFDFDPNNYDDPAQLVIYHFDDDLGQWEQLNGTVDLEAGTITVLTDNLSPFALGAPGAIDVIPEPASLALVLLGLASLTYRRRQDPDDLP